MKKRCNKGHLYEYTEQRCPICFKDRDKFRDRTDNPYDYRWQKFRKILKNDPIYGFCWECFLNDNKFNYNIHFHHILDVETYEELKYEVGNLVPLCGSHHNETEHRVRQGLDQPNWKQKKKDVLQKLKDLTTKT